MRTIAWFAVALLLTVLATAVTTIAARSKAVVHADEEFVVPPGREAEVMALLTRMREQGFAGLGVESIFIEGSEIHVQLDRAKGEGAGGCALPAWAAPPGGIVLSYGRKSAERAQSVASRGLVMTWSLCGDRSVRAEAAALVEDMASRPVRAIWQPVASTTAHEQEGGLLGAAASALGIPVSRAAVIGLLVGACGAAAAAWWFGRTRSAPAPSRARVRRVVAIAALAIAVVGAGLRVRAAAQLPPDGDEKWALAETHSIVTADHDAWVHPPVFRAVQQRWAQTAKLAQGCDPLRMRAVSLLASIASVLLLAAIVAALRSAWALVPLVTIAWAPGVIENGVLARPYALASLCVAIVAAIAWWPSRREGALRPFVALLAAGLAIWTDLVMGIVAGMLVAAMIAKAPGRARVAMILSLALWAAPLVPGALEATRSQVHPVQSSSREGPDLRQRRGPFERTASALAFGATGLPRRPEGETMLAAIGLALLVAPMALARRTPTFPATIVLPASALLVLLLAGELALRPRHLLFLPHLTAIVWMLVCDERWKRLTDES